MLEQAVILKIAKEDRIYTMVLPNNSPLGELHDVLFQMRSFVIEKINDAVKADQPKQPIDETLNQE